jgi:hypothetical protein
MSGRPKLDKYVCENCSREFDASYKKYYHKKHDCLTRINAQDIYEKYRELEKKHEELEKNYNYLVKVSRAIVVTNVNFFNFPDIGHIRLDGVVDKVNNNDWQQIHMDLVRQVYFDPENERNMSICMDESMSFGYMYTQKMNSWVKYDFEDIHKMIVWRVMNIMSDYVNENEKQFSQKVLDGFERFAQNYCGSAEGRINMRKVFKSGMKVFGRFCLEDVSERRVVVLDI